MRIRLGLLAGVDNEALRRCSGIAKGIAGDERQFGIWGGTQDADVGGIYDLGGIH